MSTEDYGTLNDFPNHFWWKGRMVKSTNRNQNLVHLKGISEKNNNKIKKNKRNLRDRVYQVQVQNLFLSPSLHTSFHL